VKFTIPADGDYEIRVAPISATYSLGTLTMNLVVDGAIADIEAPSAGAPIVETRTFRAGTHHLAVSSDSYRVAFSVKITPK
jgi:hypothetical protein